MLIRYFFIIITQLTFFSYFLHSFRAYYGFIVLPVVIYVGEHISYLFWGKWLRRHHTVVLFAIHSNPSCMPFQYGLYCSVYISVQVVSFCQRRKSSFQPLPLCLMTSHTSTLIHFLPIFHLLCQSLIPRLLSPDT